MTDNKAVVEALDLLLADSYTLYLKTHSYHWNVTGPMFTTLHTLFEQQYTELALAVDEIAERIRALGVVSRHVVHLDLAMRVMGGMASRLP